MYTFMLIIFILVSMSLILVILLQSGKGGGLAGAFGGGESATVFGSRGATTALGKATAILATLFMIIAIILTAMSGNTSTGKSVVKEQLQKQGGATTAPSDIPQPYVPTTQPGQQPATQPGQPQPTAQPAEQPQPTPQPTEGDAGAQPAQPSTGGSDNGQ